MKALPVEKLPEGNWLYEIKFDGYRALAFKNGNEVRLASRNKKTVDYPQLIDAFKGLPAEQVVLDGEIAALQMFKSSGDVHWSTTSSICCSWKGKISGISLRNQPL